jgi:hypothetical protein
MAWYLNPALTNFRNAVNAKYPGRDKGTDGTIGDRAHAGTNSDHNPDSDGSVDAWDMDVDLNGVGKPYTADVERLKAVFQEHESSQYWIHNGQIASRSTGWQRRRYTGSNRHDKHVHWNTRSSHENSNAPWVLTPPPATTSTPQGDDEMKGILANVTGRATVWYGTTRHGDLRSLSQPESENGLRLAGAVRQNYDKPEALVEALGWLPGDTDGSKTIAAVKAAG